MPRPRFDTASPTLKQAILEAASREFADSGYDGASLNQIIESSGLSKGSFYYYFDDKTDLAATVFVAASLRMAPSLEGLEAATDADGFWAALERQNRDSVAMLLAKPGDLKLVSKLGGAYVDHPELAAKVAPLIAELGTRWLKALTHGQTLGAIRGDVPLPVLMAAVQGSKESLVKVYMGRGASLSPAELERFAELTWDLARRLLAPGPSKEAS
jgi:AcrR family transcriptional regulator